MAHAAKKQKLSDGTVVAAVELPAEPIHSEHVPKKRTNKKSAANEDDKDTAAAQKRSLFVRSLPANTTSETLTELFSESYPIKHATAVIDPATKQCKGYGFVTFADAEDAARAKTEFNGRVIQDKKLRVELAERRQREDGEGVKLEKKEKVEQEKVESKLIVRNLPWSVRGGKQLEKLFLSYGKVKQAYVPTKAPGLMAGFGFVLMRGRKNAEKALEGVNGKVVDGRTLAVDWAVEKGAYQGLQGKGEDEEVKDEEVKSEDADDTEGGVEVEENEDEQFGDRLEDVSASESGSDADDGEDDNDVDVDMDSNADDRDKEPQPSMTEDKSSTLFVRNLPFTCHDEDLEDFFRNFGAVRYARVVVDRETQRTKGTGFVCFYEVDDAEKCLRGAPRRTMPTEAEKKAAEYKHALASKSILQNENTDPSGEYTLDGRVLQVTRAVAKGEANRLTEEGTNYRSKRDKDKRRLYLLSEGTIATNTKLWEQLPPSEKTMREASVKQRKTLIESNPSLNLSLTRLSVRNIPRSIGSKELKALAREAVVGFATDLKNGLREKLSREELERGGEDMKVAEATRKRAGKGLVRQAKVVYEGVGGGKVQEETGAGRSRGYGFIEYYTHRSALMGLRWLNGHAVGYRVKEQGKQGKESVEDVQDRKKRLVVEFAIENAQVVMRRNEREGKARERSQRFKTGEFAEDGEDDEHAASKGRSARGVGGKGSGGKSANGGGFGKRKRDGEDDGKSRGRDGKGSKAGERKGGKGDVKPRTAVDDKTSKRNQIIGRKRAARKVRKGGK
ncbi:RNA recognition motif-containing protein [Elasticomyces elasticus]|nr:RNA recognition motif-containing protein [Elasticomyces elasticus]KAK3647005.1 RNA recognition motif-containing protein [Elasticomyces elasticus]KAK4916919.1 RNA recognition motif-containing protein [Elasticomyces elasticus]KAK5754173.1 RNA recognition motif-containing protein [Elasticomyces elasticus]